MFSQQQPEPVRCGRSLSVAPTQSISQPQGHATRRWSRSVTPQPTRDQSARVQSTHSQLARQQSTLQLSRPERQQPQSVGVSSTSRFYGGCDVKSKLSPVFDWKNIEKRRNKSKKKKIPTWSHTFVCLSSTSQEVIPDGQERALLQIAGLGEKRISLSVYADAQDISFDLCEHFPKLSNGGGFELLRVPEGGGKMLDIIASPESGFTVSYLKAVVHHAKIYIRPLQQDLSLDPVEQDVSFYFLMIIIV